MVNKEQGYKIRLLQAIKQYLKNGLYNDYVFGSMIINMDNNIFLVNKYIKLKEFELELVYRDGNIKRYSFPLKDICYENAK